MVLSCHVALKKLALFEEYGILPSMIAAFAGPKWARVVFVFIPLLGPICCPNRFSMMSEFREPGLKLFCLVKNILHKDTN